MRDMEKKKDSDKKRHAERMRTDVTYRMRKILNTIVARCNPDSKRPDAKYYAGLPVNITIDELKALWFRDNAGAMEMPSIDRRESSAGYTFANCRFIELADNIRKAVKERDERFRQSLHAKAVTEAL